MRKLSLVVTLLVACSTPAPRPPTPRNADPASASSSASASASALASASASALASASPPEAPPPPPPPRRPGSYANVDPSDDFIVGPPDPYADCETELAAAGVKFKPATLAVHVAKSKSKITCGAPQVVTYLRGPGKIAYNAPPLLTCQMALALASFERILQTEAVQTLGSPVARIEQLGTYNCREMAAYPGWVSEHSYANAIDIGSFVLANGKTVDVLRDFDVGDAPPAKPAASFLRTVSRRANDEDVFSHVLTPFFDAHHKNHFHLDLARFRADGTRPQPASID